MIDQQIIDMLDDPDSQVRTNAVKQLARMKNQEAVQYLAAVYKTDNDPEVRELARKAGLYIKKKMAEEQWTGGDEIEEDESDSEPESETYDVSPRAVESSKGLMDSAMNAHVSGDDDRAAEFVEKAFLANPNLQYEDYYLSMAATILGVQGEQVAPMLLSDVEFKGGKAKRKRKVKEGEEDVTTEKVIIDLLIFWVVLAAIFVIGTLIQFQLLSSVMDAVVASPEFSAELSPSEAAEAEEQIALFMNLFLGAGLVATIIYSLIGSLFTVIMLLVQYAFIHFSATSILSGDGTFKGLIHKLTNFFTVSYAVYAIVMYGMIFLVFQEAATMMSDPEAMSSGLDGLLSILSFVSFVVTIGWLYWLGRLIGSNYEFGTTKGCVSVIISYILMFAIACACSFAFSAVIGNMVGSMMLSSG